MTQSLDSALLPARRVDAIEAARGFCAGYVVIAHTFQILGYRAALRPEWPLLVDLASGYAHQAVLFFFLLSGFSIHYASMGRPMGDSKSIAYYCYLRLRRVYPIFVLTVLGILGLYGLGIFVGLPHYRNIWQSLNWAEVWATLSFVVDRNYVCGVWFQPMPTNPPFWSLSYEMLYYLLYPLFLWVARRWHIGAALGAGVAASLIATLIGMHHCGHLSNVMSLYFIWCLGAVVADFKRKDCRLPLSRSAIYLISFVSLIGAWLIHESRFASFDTLAWVALFFVILAYPASQARHERLSLGQRLICLSAAGVVTLAVAALSYVKAPSADMPLFYARLGLFLLLWGALVMGDSHAWPGHLTKILLRRLSLLGSISYALYLIHYPMLIFARELVAALNWPINYALLVLPVVLTAAYLLEKYVQPGIVQYCEHLRTTFRAPSQHTV